MAGIIYKASRDTSSSRADAVYRGDPIAKYENGIVYKASRDTSSSRADAVYQGDPIAKYDGDSDGAAAAAALILMGLIESQTADQYTGSSRGASNSIWTNVIGYLIIPILVAAILSYIYLPLIVGIVVLSMRIISSVLHRELSITPRSMFQGAIFGIGVWLLSIMLWDASTVLPGIIDASSMSGLFDAMLPYIAWSLVCYIPNGILRFCDEKARPKKKTIVIISVLSVISIIVNAIQFGGYVYLL